MGCEGGRRGVNVLWMIWAVSKWWVRGGTERCWIEGFRMEKGDG